MFVRIWPTEKLLYLPCETNKLEDAAAKYKGQYQTARAQVDRRTSEMVLSPKSLAGPGYVMLNVIRAMNIVALMADIAACVIMLVKTSHGSNFFFFDAISHVLTAITAMFLLVSEFSLFRGYFARNWPLLSPSHGFVTLAFAMIVIGINMLGCLNKPATSPENLGMAFWRVLIASGVVTFILGHVNLVASYVFRDRKQGITARQVRAKGAVAVHQSPMPGTEGPSAPELAQSLLPKPVTTPTKNHGFNFFSSERRNSALPSYHSSSTVSSPIKEAVSPSSKYSRATDCSKKVFSFMGRNRQSVGPKLPVNVKQREMQISAPMGVNPQFAHLVRPDSAMHPSRSGESDTYRWKSNV